MRPRTPRAFLLGILLLSLAGCPHPGLLPPSGHDLVPLGRFGARLVATVRNLARHTAWVSRKVAEIKGALARNGFRLLGSGVIESPTHGTHAYVASDGRRLLVVFRGTGGETIEKWVRSIITDARFFPTVPRFLDRRVGGERVRVHTGFTRAYEAKRERLLRVVRAHPGEEVWVTGHSLGAAMATLAAVDVSVNLKRKVHAVLFASPRVGNQAFARTFEKAVPDALRIERVDDPITRVPPHSPLSPYVHVGRLLAFRPDGTLATPEELRAGFAIPLRIKVHFQPHYRKLLQGLAERCRRRPASCDGPPMARRLVAAARAERAASRQWWRAAKRLFKRLAAGLLK